MCYSGFQREIIRTVTGPIGVMDSTKAEVMSLLMGIWELHDLHSYATLVEGDLSVVVGWGLGSSPGS